MPSSRDDIIVFYSYAEEDRVWQSELEKHLNRPGNFIQSYHRGSIRAGYEMEREIPRLIEEASLILLLLSPDYFASNHHPSLEMQEVLRRSQESKVVVISILVRPCNWEATPLARYPILPRNQEALSLWNDQDSALVQVAKDLDKVLKSLHEGLRSDRALLDALGPDFEVRQRAISQVAKADPTNIQEVAASQLSIINSYYQSGLQQSQQSFHWSLIWGGIGLSFLIAAVSFLLFRQSTDVAIASGIGGAIVEVFAATYLYLYKHASDQLAAFRTSLEGTQRLLLANSMCEKLEGEIEQNTRAELIRAMVDSVTNSSLPIPHEKGK